MQDGLLDLTRLPPTTFSAQLVQARRLYNGSLGKWPDSDRRQVETLQAFPLTHEDVFIDLDGELAGQLPARFTVLKRALHMRGGWLENPLISRE